MLRRAPILLACLAISAGVAVAAHAADRADSGDCRDALLALQVQEDKAASLPQGDRPARVEALKQVEALRRAAARACLGGTGDPPPPAQHYVVPRAAVPPPAPARPSAPTAAPPAAPVVSMPRTTQPPVITSCDGGGCWTSDGSRVQRDGPAVRGPTGACALQGLAVRCP